MMTMDLTTKKNGNTFCTLIKVNLNSELCGIQNSLENTERDGNTRSTHLPLEKPVCKSGSNS